MLQPFRTSSSLCNISCSTALESHSEDVGKAREERPMPDCSLPCQPVTNYFFPSQYLGTAAYWGQTARKSVVFCHSEKHTYLALCQPVTNERMTQYSIPERLSKPTWKIEAGSYDLELNITATIYMVSRQQLCIVYFAFNGNCRLEKERWIS